MEKKPKELLDRLKIVKVTSEGTTEDKSQRALPQSRERVNVPTFGYEDPKVIPEGKCSLKQALEYISNHTNDPDKHSIESIAKSYGMKQTDVENVMQHFRVFQLYVARDDKKSSKLVTESLGVNKVLQPIYKPEFAHLEKPKSDTPDDSLPPKK